MPCVECDGRAVHHFDDLLAQTAEGDPDHPAAKLGIEVWWQCKHCDAWLEYGDTDEDGAPDTSCFATQPPPPPPRQRAPRRRGTLLGGVHPAAICRCGHRADSHAPDLPSPCGFGRTMPDEEIIARCCDPDLSKDPRYGCGCMGFSRGAPS